MSTRRAPGRRWVARLAATALAVGMLGLAAGTASAIDDVPVSYPGPEYGDPAVTVPYRYGQQDKLWFHAGAWWALMRDDTDGSLRVHELLPDHTWRRTDAVINRSPQDTGDAVAVGDTLNVVSRGTDSVATYLRLTYDADDRQYQQTGPAAVVTDLGKGAPLSLAENSIGWLWAAFATTTDVMVTTSGDRGRTWSAPLSIAPLSGPEQGRQVASVVAFDDNVGVLWSDQAAAEVRFGVHRNGRPSSEWQVETALAGLGPVENEISLQALDREPSDAVVAAATLAQGELGDPPDSPLVMVLSRSPDGVWSRTTGATVGDALRRPVVQLDATNQMAYLLGHAGGTVFAKQAPLDGLSFAPGRGRSFVTGGPGVVDEVGSGQPVDARTGMVVLAAGLDGRYYHAEVGIPGVPAPSPEPDTVAPNAPPGLVATAVGSAVRLYWSASPDGNAWAPAADHRSARNYIVLRDGTEIGSTTQTSFADDPGAGTSHQYAVRAVDAAENVSPLSTTTVTVGENPLNPVAIVGWTLLAVGAAIVVGLVVRRWAPPRTRRGPGGESGWERIRPATPDDRLPARRGGR